MPGMPSVFHQRTDAALLARFLLKHFNDMLPMWELWHSMERLSPCSEKERDIEYILRRQERKMSPEDGGERGASIYSSYTDFPPDVVHLLGLGHDTAEAAL